MLGVCRCNSRTEEGRRWLSRFGEMHALSYTQPLESKITHYKSFQLKQPSVIIKKYLYNRIYINQFQTAYGQLKPVDIILNCWMLECWIWVFFRFVCFCVLLLLLFILFIYLRERLFRCVAFHILIQYRNFVFHENLILKLYS